MDENALLGEAIFTSKRRLDICLKRSLFFSAVDLFNIGGVVQRWGGGGGGDGKDRQEGDDGRRGADGGGGGSGGGCGSRHSRLRWRTEAAPPIGRGIY